MLSAIPHAVPNTVLRMIFTGADDGEKVDSWLKAVGLNSSQDGFTAYSGGAVYCIKEAGERWDVHEGAMDVLIALNGLHYVS